MQDIVITGPDQAQDVVRFRPAVYRGDKTAGGFVRTDGPQHIPDRACHRFIDDDGIGMMPVDQYGDFFGNSGCPTPITEAFHFRHRRLKEIGVLTDEYQILLFTSDTGNGGTSSCVPEHREAVGFPDHP